MFENATIVDNFLAFWRTTGRQRVGFLYGRYEIFPDVPLGIRAVVCAIYEPPQETTRDFVKILEDDKEVLKRLFLILVPKCGTEKNSIACGCRNKPEYTSIRGKYNCTANLVFDWFGFYQTSKADANST